MRTKERVASALLAEESVSRDAQRFRYFQRGCPERGITCQALIKTTRVGIANVGLQFVADFLLGAFGRHADLDLFC